jgi:hypothetical protein
MYTIRTAIIATLLMLTFKATAQDCFYDRNVHEVGVMLGATYYMGDFNPNRTPLFYPSFYGGAMYRYNFQRHFALRAQLGYGYIRGNGSNVDGIIGDHTGNNWRFNRPWVFANLLAEFNFMPYSAAYISRKQRFTPVLALGVGGSYLSPNSGRGFIQHPQRGVSGIFFDLPVVVGIKWCFIKRFTLGAEWTWRLTLYDGIDYYPLVNEKHSNPIDNDWIGTIGISVSYLIHEKLPCPAFIKYVPPRLKFKGIREEQSKSSKRKRGIR